MSKDPAVLFYTSDFISGTLTMSHEQRGKYILLLCLQHQKGYLTEKDMLNISGTYDEDIWQKFEKSDGKFYNKRMQAETEKRAAYSESRRKNRAKKETSDDDMLNISNTYDNHMENENENENINANGSEIEKKKPQQKKSDGITKALQTCFEDEYKRRTGLDYQFAGGKDGTNLSQLKTKIHKSIIGAGREPTTEMMVNTLQALMTKHNDKWINDNFSISILNSKYNEIVSNIKNRQPKSVADMQQQVNAELDKYFGARQ
jgi:hypothetical protein